MYQYEKDLSFKEIHTDTVAIVGDGAPVLSTIQKWAAKFRKRPKFKS